MIRTRSKKKCIGIKYHGLETDKLFTICNPDHKPILEIDKDINAIASLHIFNEKFPLKKVVYNFMRLCSVKAFLDDTMPFKKKEHNETVDSIIKDLEQVIGKLDVIAVEPKIKEVISSYFVPYLQTQRYQIGRGRPPLSLTNKEKIRMLILVYTYGTGKIPECRFEDEIKGYEGEIYEFIAISMADLLKKLNIEIGCDDRIGRDIITILKNPSEEKNLIYSRLLEL